MAADSVFVTAPPKIVENDSSYSFVSYFSVVFFGLSKTETAAKTAHRVPKLGYKGGRAPQLSAWGTLALLSVAGVVCHIYEV